jgi:hypothetical protein
MVPKVYTKKTGEDVQMQRRVHQNLQAASETK